MGLSPRRPDRGANPRPDRGANPRPDRGANPRPDRGANPRPAANEASKSGPALASEGLLTPRAAGARAGDLNGIYGTRSANRRRMAQRRRVIQNIAVVTAVVAAGAAWVAWQRGPREAVAPTIWSRNLSSEPSATPELIPATGRAGAQWLLPTANGHLMVAGDDGRRFVDRSISDFAFQSPALSEGERAFIAGQDGSLYAVNWHSGHVLWSFRGPSPMTTRPAFLASPLSSPPSHASNSPSQAAATPAHGATAPLTAPNTTPAALSGKAAVIAADDQGIVTALSASGGKVLWHRDLAAPVGDALVIARDGKRPLLLAPLLAGALSRGGLRALDARDGREVWRYPVDEKIVGAQLTPPVVDAASDRVFCSDDAGAVACVSLHTGRKKWKNFVPSLPGAPADDAVVLRSGPTLVRLEHGAMGIVVAGNDGGVRCLDAATGALKWSRAVGGALRGALPLWTPSHSPHPLIAVAPFGAPALLLDATDGRSVARLPTEARSEANRVWLGAAGDHLLAVEVNSAAGSATMRALSAPAP